MAAEKPLSKYSGTEYNRSERVLSALRDIYSRARSFHSPHSKILEDLDKLCASHDFKRLTSYYRGKLDGTHYAIRDALYQYHLEWRVFYAGKLVPSKEVPDGEWSKVESDKGQHVWRDAPENIF